MRTCQQCQQTTSFLEDGAICARCAIDNRRYNQALTLRYLPDDNAISVLSDDGLIVGRQEWLSISRLIDAYYDTKTDAEIKSANAQVSEARLQEQDSRSGYIYLIRSDNGYCKIGRTTNVARRLNEHSRAYPYKLTVLTSAWFQDSIAAESLLLKGFADQRVQSEWFVFNDAEIEWFLVHMEEWIIGLDGWAERPLERAEYKALCLKAIPAFEGAIEACYAIRECYPERVSAKFIRDMEVLFVQTKLNYRCFP